MKLLIVVALLISTASHAATECVVLLHGLARSATSMQKIEKRLVKEGYRVINYAYPSTKHAIPELAKEHIPKALKQCGDSEKVNFVTHSMGAIVLRQFLVSKQLSQLNRVVMLGPPNQGSQVVDKLKNVPGFKLINGPAGAQLGTAKTDIPATLGAAVGEVGVIAGSKSINPLLSLLLPKPNDGKVSVDNTKLSGMTDHLIVRVSHPFLMKDKQVINQVVWFLANGEFNRYQEK